jgi:phage gpG-like protein
VASSAGVRISGLKSTVRSLQKLGVEVTDLKAAFRKVADVVTGTARGLVHNQTGTLAANIRPGNSKNRATVRAGGARVPYAGVINYGWPGHNIQAQHFLERAAQQDEPRSVRLIDEELRAIIRKLDL